MVGDSEAREGGLTTSLGINAGAEVWVLEDRIEDGGVRVTNGKVERLHITHERKRGKGRDVGLAEGYLN